MKQCSECREFKELSEFYSQNKTRKDGTKYIYYNPECKECTKKRTYTWQEKHIDKKRKYALKDNAKPHRKQQMKILNKKRRENGEYREWQQNNTDKIKEYAEKRSEKIHEISENEWDSCKNYFNYRCAYCGLAIEEHYIRFNGKIILGDFHRDHADDKGENDLSNCIPSCKICNTSKHDNGLDEWYNENNPNFSQTRLNKIHEWLDKDYKKYIDKK
jgi:predicted ATP-dependent protease